MGFFLQTTENVVKRKKLPEILRETNTKPQSYASVWALQSVVVFIKSNPITIQYYIKQWNIHKRRQINLIREIKAEKNQMINAVQCCDDSTGFGVGMPL